MQVDNDIHTDLKVLTLNITTAHDALLMFRKLQKVIEDLPSDSFWEQQVEAVSKKDSCGMHWHPLMIYLGPYTCDTGIQQALQFVICNNFF